MKEKRDRETIEMRSAAIELSQYVDIVRWLPKLVVVSTLCLLACSAVVKNPVPLESLPASDRVFPLPEYKIQPGDVLAIKFFHNAELNEEITVRPDGRISLQLAHEIMAANRTPAELTDVLTDRYASELSDPEITVIVRSFNSQKVYVGGEVNKPALVYLNGRTTALQAIVQSGGLKNTARTGEVVLIRRKADYTPMAVVLDLENVINGKDMSQDIVLVPHDILIVPKSPIANVNQFVENYIRNVLPLRPDFGFSYRINEK